MSGNRADAEDALSSAGIKASQYLATHPHEITNIKAWLTKLLFNHCMNLRKTNQRGHRYVPLAFATDRLDDVSTGPVQAPPEEAALRHEMQMYVRGNVNQLPPSLREPLVLYFFENMSQREVAAYLNLSYEVVRKRLQLARAILRKQMLPYVKYGEGRSVRTSVDTVEDIALRPAPVH
jgi:RNA polymerase sigma-70 factor (ECF subfamily)